LNRPIFSFKSCGRRSLSAAAAAVFLVVFVVWGVAPSVGGVDDSSMREAVQAYVRNGTAELDRGEYAAAEKTLRMAASYQEYLSDADRQELTALLERAQAGVVSRSRITEIFRIANELRQRRVLRRSGTTRR